MGVVLRNSDTYHMIHDIFLFSLSVLSRVGVDGRGRGTLLLRVEKQKHKLTNPFPSLGLCCSALPVLMRVFLAEAAAAATAVVAATTHANRGTGEGGSWKGSRRDLFCFFSREKSKKYVPAVLQRVSVCFWFQENSKKICTSIQQCW